MLKKIMITTAIVLQSASFGFAQTAPAPAPAPAAAYTPAANAHFTYDQQLRACRIQATAQQLQGDAMSAFVAQCMNFK
jgi:hypothetical protein